MIIETARLRIISCDIPLLKSAIAGNQQLAVALNASVHDNWTEFGEGALKYSLHRLLENEEDAGWWTYLPVHKKDNRLIGSGGYKGRPSEDGSVELGYEISPAYRNQGLATEMAKGLIEHACRNPGVARIIAHTLGEVNPSTQVLRKCGFEKVQEIKDPEEGLIWKWVLEPAEVR